MLSGNFNCDWTAFRSIGETGERIGLGVLRKNKEVDRKSGPESFPFFSVCILLEGRGMFEDCFSGKCHPLESGMYFLRIPGIKHCVHIDVESNYQECFLDLGRYSYPYFQTYSGITPEHPTGSFLPDEDWLDRFCRLKKELELCPEAKLFSLIPSFFQLASDCLVRTPSGGRLAETIEKSCLFLGSDFREKKDFSAFCRENGWGYENFRKIFHKTLGISPGQYRQKRRMEAAEALLLQPRLTLSEIAERLGYHSVYEFSEQFSRHAGMSPGKFRNDPRKIIKLC